MADIASVFGRHEFLIRRLHSLTGLVPVGGFLVIHLLTNMGILDNSYQQRVDLIHSMGERTLQVTEWGLIFLPILFHGIIGLIIVARGSATWPITPMSRTFATRCTLDWGNRLCVHPLARLSDPRLDQYRVVAGKHHETHGWRSFQPETGGNHQAPGRSGCLVGRPPVCGRNRVLGLPLSQRPVDDGDHVGRVDWPPRPGLGHGLLGAFGLALAGAGLAALYGFWFYHITG